MQAQLIGVRQSRVKGTHDQQWKTVLPAACLGYTCLMPMQQECQQRQPQTSLLQRQQLQDEPQQQQTKMQ